MNRLTKNEGKLILILGGTGAMGMYLAPLLVDYGYTVDVTTRKDHQSNAPRLRYLKGDAKDASFIESILSDNRYAAIFDFMLYSFDEFKDRYNLLLDSTEQYTFFSSYRVYADVATAITENAERKIDLLDNHPEFAKDTYSINKGKQENLLLNSDRRNWTIIRPPMTYSSNRFQFGVADNFDVIRSQRGLISALPNTITEKTTSLAYGKDIAKMLARLVENEKAIGQCFNVSTGENHTWHEVSQVYERVFGLQCKEVRRDDYIVAYQHEGTLIDREMNRAFDATKILNATSLSQKDFYTLESGLREAWSTSNKSRFVNSTRALESHVLVDKLTNSVVDYSKIPSSLRDSYDSLSKELRGNYPHVAAPNDHANADTSHGTNHVSNEKNSSSVKRTRLIAKGVKNIKKNGVLDTLRRTRRWIKKKR